MTACFGSRMSASAEARRLKSGGAMLAITGSQGSGVDFDVPVIVLMVVLSAVQQVENLVYLCSTQSFNGRKRWIILAS